MLKNLFERITYGLGSGAMGFLCILVFRFGMLALRAGTGIFAMVVMSFALLFGVGASLMLAWMLEE